MCDLCSRPIRRTPARWVRPPSFSARPHCGRTFLQRVKLRGRSQWRRVLLFPNHRRVPSEFVLQEIAHLQEPRRDRRSTSSDNRESFRALQVRRRRVPRRTRLNEARAEDVLITTIDRKSTRLNSSHLVISYAVFCLKKKKKRKNSRE